MYEDLDDFIMRNFPLQNVGEYAGDDPLGELREYYQNIIDRNYGGSFQRFLVGVGEESEIVVEDDIAQAAEAEAMAMTGVDNTRELAHVVASDTYGAMRMGLKTYGLPFLSFLASTVLGGLALYAALSMDEKVDGNTRKETTLSYMLGGPIAASTSYIMGTEIAADQSRRDNETWALGNSTNLLGPRKYLPLEHMHVKDRILLADAARQTMQRSKSSKSSKGFKCKQLYRMVKTIADGPQIDSDAAEFIVALFESLKKISACNSNQLFDSVKELQRKVMLDKTRVQRIAKSLVEYQKTMGKAEKRGRDATEALEVALARPLSSLPDGTSADDSDNHTLLILINLPKNMDVQKWVKDQLELSKQSSTGDVVGYVDDGAPVYSLDS